MYETTRRHKPEDTYLNIHFPNNFNYYVALVSPDWDLSSNKQQAHLTLNRNVRRLRSF